MNKNLSKLLATVLVAVMLIFTMPMIMPQVKASTPPEFYVMPTTESFTTATTTVGTTFTVTLYGAVAATDQNGLQTATWSAELSFDPTMLACQSVTLTSGANSAFFAPAVTNGAVTTGLSKVINNVAGTILCGEGIAAPGPYLGAQDASLVTIVFKILKAPAPAQILTTNIDPGYGVTIDESFFLDTSIAEEAGITTAFCTYSYSWSAPTTTPYFAVSLSQSNFIAGINWNGMTFTATLALKNVDPAWFVTNAHVVLTYNSSLVVATSIAFDPAWTAKANITTPVPNGGTITFDVSNPAGVSGSSVTIATITFTIIGQGVVPPYPFGGFDTSAFNIQSTTLSSTLFPNLTIPIGAPTNALATVFAFSAVSPPYLQVDYVPPAGQAPGTGMMFNVTVTIYNVQEFEHLVGIQFYMGYDPTMLQPVKAWEGPFLPSFVVGNDFGTFFDAVNLNPDGLHPPASELVADLILPDINTGLYSEPYPSGNGVVATIEFLVVGAPSTPTFTTSLNIVDYLALKNDTTEMALNPPHNLQVTLYSWVGRTLDLFGGAVNDGNYGLGPPGQPGYNHLIGAPYWQFPAPYGGQGPNMPMDLVLPQSQVYLWTNVTYNGWPVANKLVGFEIMEPDGTVYSKFTSATDANGIAGVTFRMPWPSTNPESLFGVWTVTSTVSIADQQVNDTMQFEYDYLVHIWKVTTDNNQYVHGAPVGITVYYGTLAQQYYPALFVTQIVDNLLVTDGIYQYSTTVGGASAFNVYANSNYGFTITIPYWAYAGCATVYTNAFSMEPTIGGVAITPEYVGPTLTIEAK